MSSLKPVESLSTPELVDLLKSANKAYRAGTPIMPDLTYDQVYLAELAKREPNHPFLDAPEVEGDFGIGKVRHKSPLLSTDKAYTLDEIEAYVRRIHKAADEVGVDQVSVRFRMTPKLDGIAGSYDSGRLATRGSGLVGNDISHIFTLGAIAIGGADTGPGEVVIDKGYWNENLVEIFDHPRNMIAGVASADRLNDDAKEALEAGALRFVPFSHVNHVDVSAETLVAQLDELCSQLESSAGYETDGVVIEVTDPDIKSYMGSTNHHHRWQIAKKKVGATAEAQVEGINWQVGRSGRITPVIVIEPTKLSGAIITHVTGHHAGNVRNQNIGPGARIKLVRSGEVIPKLLTIVAEGESLSLPECCPACEGGVQWSNDFLICTNDACQARIESRLSHFFTTLGNVDLFGPKTIATLVDNGVTTLPEIYRMEPSDFISMGFGPKQSRNLVDQLSRSRSEAVENWRFLAAFGIHHLGRGDSRRLLAAFDLAQLEGLSASDIQQVEHFGPVTAPKIALQLKGIWPLIRSMLDFGFNLISDNTSQQSDSALAGKNIVFTGKLSQPREAMQESARQHGANVQSSVGNSTDILVAGESVGAKKIEAAKAKGVTILSESEYLALRSEQVSTTATAISEPGVQRADSQETLELDFEL